jgi:hypothetical protein
MKSSTLRMIPIAPRRPKIGDSSARNASAIFNTMKMINVVLIGIDSRVKEPGLGRKNLFCTIKYHPFLHPL